ncbi:monovalent cation/H+ antiporter subunit D family protein [Cellulomonas bogoriensis]|uniref:Cation:proton antiporter n=1 Tax=Cellulomonas bogoriensis 69B4 = DSM 16987 TaxID=1386082 RepID=A0A0A0C1N5_9CELL|nr:monovalent cation/H+ antiporter subunit D family protein [Cellulomonas bogoriensis]KGM13877.1 cation:proton antiporter [Cellulomonas bogoriensis 69B4 = DSM 16987]
MNTPLLPLVVAVPLLLGALLVSLEHSRRLRTALLLGPSAAAVAAGGWLIAETRDGTVLVHNVGLWPDGIAIPFVADAFSSLMVTATAVLTLVCSAFAVSTGTARARYFPALVLFLSAGVYGALLTADLFNLFVFIEVMLLPSYGMLAMTGGLNRLGAGRLYVAVNLLTSTVFLAGVALIYGVAGTVNMGELAGAAHESPLVAIAAGVCLLALSVKAAVVPVHGWLTRTYPATSPAVTALFSGLHTKVAIYAIYRMYAVLFDGDQRYLWIGLVVFSATMVVGVIGAVGQDTTRSILVFHMISQIGYILIGVALFTPLGLMAGIFYLVHNMVAKTSLFLSTGAIEHAYGHSRLDRLGGLARREPLLAVVFIGAALSLAGLPPFSGFVAKLTLALAIVEEGQWAVLVAAIAVSLITLMSMLKIWGTVFWGPKPDDTDEAAGTGTGIATDEPLGTPAARTAPDSGAAAAGRSAGTAPVSVAEATEAGAEPRDDEGTRPRVRPGLLAPALVLTVLTLALGLGAEAMLDLSTQAAQNLLDTSSYVEAVIGR